MISPKLKSGLELSLRLMLRYFLTLYYIDFVYFEGQPKA